MLEPLYFNWLIAAIIFFILEVFSYSLLGIWLGVASLLMAAISFFFPGLSFTIQSFIFAFLLTASVLTWYITFKKSQQKSGDNALNNRAARYIGKMTIVDSISDQGHIKIKIEDSLWLAISEDTLEIGEKVVVVNAKGTTLYVKKVS